MSRKKVQLGVLMTVVADQERVFATKDVSNDSRMKLAHPDLATHSNYHAFVGGALSDHHVDLGITQIGQTGQARWEKNGLPKCATTSVTKEPDSAAIQEQRPGLGPQYKGDSPFAARMRLHQSWYRTNVLRISYGAGPTSGAKNYYGNMLTRSDGEAGRNFLTPEIAQVARDRVAQGRGACEPFRLFHNMLSSQPMCFNLFGPLVKDRALAARLLKSIVREKVAEVTRVAIEWAPEPPEAYLGDRTAFDAFIEYRNTDGQLYALGVETKLVEPFSQNDYDGECYRRWMRVVDAPWRPDADAAVNSICHNQLWRDHLLAVALRHQPRSPYAGTRLMLVRHPEDRDCAHVMTEYRRLLRDDDDSLIDMPLDQLISVWAEALADGPYHDWIREFRVRYLELERSAQAASG